MYSTGALDIRGYRGETVPNTYFAQQDDASHLAVVLPGSSYTCHMPLLYYPSKLLLDLAADVLWVQYSYNRADFTSLPQDEQARWFLTDVTAACRAALGQGRYGRITLVGKSLGTLAMGYLLTMGPPFSAARAVWLTPLLRDDSLRGQIAQWGGASLFAIGTADPHYDPALVSEVEAATGGRGLVFEGADHSLEIEGNVSNSLKIMEDVLRAIEEFAS